MALLGIDLGTTFSAMAYLNADGLPVTIANAEGDMTTPSVILFEKNGDIIVGREARRAALAEPACVAECVKRHMGEPYFPKLINGKTYTPIGLSSLILSKLKKDAEQRIGAIEGVVITVPAYFDEVRRQATAAAGRLAGFKVLDVLNEPTAATLAYAFEKLSNVSRKDAGAVTAAPASAAPLSVPASPPLTVLAYDLGGGTFDVTVLQMAGGDLKVLATAGDVRLGGRDWDERLFTHMANEFVHAHNEDPREDPVSAQALMMMAEETKKILSSRKQTSFVINHAGKTYRGDITREQFDQLTSDLLYRTENRLTRVIKQAKLDWQQVGEVLAIGGSVRMPQVLEMLSRVTGKAPNCTLSPDEAVAHGAAIQAAVCLVKEREASEAAARSAAASPAPGMRPPPIAAGKSGGGLLTHFKSRIVDLLGSIHTTNVNAHSLGVVATGPAQNERVSVLIPHDTQLPVSVTKRFGTASDNQRSVTVRIVEGESRDPAECMVVGSCQIRQLPVHLRKGSPIDVMFTYDNSSRLHVKAVDVSSGNWAEATIHRRSGIISAALEYDPKDGPISSSQPLRPAPSPAAPSAPARPSSVPPPLPNLSRAAGASSGPFKGLSQMDSSGSPNSKST